MDGRVGGGGVPFLFTVYRTVPLPKKKKKRKKGSYLEIYVLNEMYVIVVQVSVRARFPQASPQTVNFSSFPFATKTRVLFSSPSLPTVYSPDHTNKVLEPHPREKALH
jgi:hypothetical protein